MIIIQVKIDGPRSVVEIVNDDLPHELSTLVFPSHREACNFALDHADFLSMAHADEAQAGQQ